MTRAQYSDRFIVLDGDGESHGDYKTADRTIEQLRRHKDEPFFIACGFVKPHSPPTAPRRFYEMFPDDQIELPADFAARPTVPAGFPRGSIRPRNADLFIGRDATPAAAKEMIRAYLASASWTDFNAGRVLAELDRLGLRENTIIVFWGDHGYQLGEKGKWSKAGSLWEQGARTPLIIAAPNAMAKGNGKSSPRIMQNLDLYRTLAELCGLKVQDGVEGRSLVPLLNDPNAAWDFPAFTIWSEDGRGPTGIAVRTERWRYAEFGPGGVGEAMLLDELNDPQELKNVVDEPANDAVRAELAAKVKAYAARYQAR
jgi:arylsulfatase A-like enzyme